MSIEDDMQKVQRLRDCGVLSDGEFEREKARVLRDAQPHFPPPIGPQNTRAPREPLSRWKVAALAVFGLIVAFLVFGITAMNQPGAKERAQARDVVNAVCNGHDSAGLYPYCYQLRNDFKDKYGYYP